MTEFAAWLLVTHHMGWRCFKSATPLHLHKCVTWFNHSINKFITRHSTEARATMSLSQTEKECLKSVLENVNGRSSPTAQWKRVPESWCRDRETTSSNVDVVRGNGKNTLC